MRFLPTFLAVLAMTPSGCGQSEYQSLSADREADYLVESVEALPSRTQARSELAPEPTKMAGMMGAADASEPRDSDAPPPADTLSRKIIYDAQIDLEVEDLDPIADRIATLIEQHGGYIADQNLSGAPGSQRSGRWKLRVPVENFEDLVRDVLALGEMQRNQRSSQDVTEQFYDLEAQIRNKRVEEETLLKILEERSGKLEDVLKVEVELSRVRGEIERMEGKLRVLANLSSLATVTLNVRERTDYTPEPPVAPDFSTRIARAWTGSIEDLRQLGENLVIFAVGAAPWLPLILLILVVAVVLIRRFIRALPRLWEIGQRPIAPPRPPQ